MNKTNFMNRLMVLFFALLFSACGKESTNENRVGNYIDKIYFTETFGGVTDTITVDINYDALKRVVSLDGGTVHNWQFFYNGNEMNPSRAIIKSYNSDPYTIYYTYNSTGLKVRDSIIYTLPSTPRTRVISYTYAAGKIITFDQSIGGASYTRDTAFLDASGNIVENRKRSYYDSPTPTQFNFIHSTFTYDNFSHPFSSMNIFNAIRNLPFGETFFLDMFTPNNWITQRESSSLNGDYDVDYSYEYNSNGFPTKIVGGPGSNSDVTLITYKAL